MGENSAIEWTDHSLSFWFGCTNVSPACDHCYAEAMSKRFGWAEWGHGRQRVKSKSAIEAAFRLDRKAAKAGRSEEHTSELQSLMRISYAVFCLKKKKKKRVNQAYHVKHKNTIRV